MTSLVRYVGSVLSEVKSWGAARGSEPRPGHRTLRRCPRRACRQPPRRQPTAREAATAGAHLQIESSASATTWSPCSLPRRRSSSRTRTCLRPTCARCSLRLGVGYTCNLAGACTARPTALPLACRAAQMMGTTLAATLRAPVPVRMASNKWTTIEHGCGPRPGITGRAGLTSQQRRCAALGRRARPWLGPGGARPLARRRTLHRLFPRRRAGIDPGARRRSPPCGALLQRMA